jgi:hypothetical protein
LAVGAHRAVTGEAGWAWRGGDAHHFS